MITKNVKICWPRIAGLMAIVFCLAEGYEHVTAAEIRFLLWPVSTLTGMVTGSAGIWTEQGYWHPGLSMVIDRSCAGFRFWMIAWLLAGWSLQDRWDQHRKYALGMLCALIPLYFLTIFTTSSRILSLIFTRPLFGYPQPPWLHMAQGGVVSLSWLMLFYIGLQWSLKKY